VSPLQPPVAASPPPGPEPEQSTNASARCAPADSAVIPEATDAPPVRASAPSALLQLEGELRAERRRTAAMEERLKHVHASLQQVLEQLEAQQVNGIELQTILTATEQRLVTLEATLAERERELATLRIAKARADDAEGVVAEEMRPPSDAESAPKSRGSERAGAIEIAPAPALPLQPPSAHPPAAATTAPAEKERAAAVTADSPLTIVHIEDQPGGRDAVRAAVSKQPGVRYVCPQFPPAGAIRSATLLTVNLMCRHLDPLAVIGDAPKWGVPEPRAFTYCSDGTRTMLLGLIEYFPFPFDPEACATRLLERPQGARRILAVSSHIELMTRLRTALSAGRCSTTVALDGRQALDLVKPVDPDTIVIDLAMPRGEALDTVHRLYARPNEAIIPIAFLWSQKLASGIFHQYAARLLQDWRGDNTGVAPALIKLLGSLQADGTLG